MDKPIFVITETRDQYIQRKDNATIVKVLWVVFISFLVTNILNNVLIKGNTETYLSIMLFFIFIFGVSDLIGAGKIKSVLKTILGFSYILISLTIAIASLIYGITSTPELVITIIGILLFSYLGYHNIKNYSNLINLISK